MQQIYAMCGALHRSGNCDSTTTSWFTSLSIGSCASGQGKLTIVVIGHEVQTRPFCDLACKEAGDMVVGGVVAVGAGAEVEAVAVPQVHDAGLCKRSVNALKLVRAGSLQQWSQCRSESMPPDILDLVAPTTYDKRRCVQIGAP